MMVVLMLGLRNLQLLESLVQLHHVHARHPPLSSPSLHMYVEVDSKMHPSMLHSCAAQRD